MDDDNLDIILAIADSAITSVAAADGMYDIEGLSIILIRFNRLFHCYGACAASRYERQGIRTDCDR